MPEQFRPDLTKVVLTADRKTQRLVAHCDTNNPIAWRKEPIYSLLKRQAASHWASDVTVMAKAGTRAWLITPTQEVDLGQLSERTPFSIRKFPDGSAIVDIHPEINPDEAGLSERPRAGP